MNAKLAIGAALVGAAVLGAAIVAYGNAQGDKPAAAARSAAPTTAAFDGAEEEAIRAIVKKYLVQNPEVLVEALTAYDEKQHAEAEAASLAAAKKNLAALVGAENGFVAGVDPAGAKVAVVELFDYHCGFCKRAMGLVQQLTKSDRAVKVVFRELPMLREESEYAAKAALAARAQGKYAEMHFAMMGASGILTKERVKEIAASKGVDVARLEKDIAGAEVAKALKETEAIAKAMQVDGTPTFIVAAIDGSYIEVIPGFREEDLAAAVKKAKKAAKP